MATLIKVKSINDSSIKSNKLLDYIKSIDSKTIFYIGIGIIIAVSLISILARNLSLSSSSTEDTVNTEDVSVPIINPKFGTDYSGGGGLDILYDDLGGNDPLKDGKLNALIDIDTEKYSCKFDVKYEGENKKKIECLRGCYNGDENSTFCESYIYNDQINGGKTLDTLYDDAGGNESSRSGQYISKINVSAGDQYDDEEDIDCRFIVEYDGSNRRSVLCTNGCVDENDSNADSNRCNPYIYKNRREYGEKGDTLLDETYISRRGSLPSIEDKSPEPNDNPDSPSDDSPSDDSIIEHETEPITIIIIGTIIGIILGITFGTIIGNKLGAVIGAIIGIIIGFTIGFVFRNTMSNKTIQSSPPPGSPSTSQ